jgi:hypothetical protein
LIGAGEAVPRHVHCAMSIAMVGYVSFAQSRRRGVSPQLDLKAQASAGKATPRNFLAAATRHTAF